MICPCQLWGLFSTVGRSDTNLTAKSGTKKRFNPVDKLFPQDMTCSIMNSLPDMITFNIELQHNHEEEILVGGFNHLEKYESQWEGLYHILWKIKNVWNHQPVVYNFTGWWYTYPSEKYDFVSWDDDIPNIWKNNPNIPNHQPVYNNNSVWYMILIVIWRYPLVN